MSNLYSYTKAQDAARKLARVERDIAGNMPPAVRVYRKSALRIRCRSGGTKRSVRPSFDPMLLPALPMASEMRPPNSKNRTNPIIRMCQMLRPNMLASRLR
jgi:hypothetical protein